MSDLQEEAREALPNGLDVVRDFVNTVDLEEGEEGLGSPEALRDWLAARGLVSGDEELGEADLARARELREALRALLRANNGEELSPAAVEVLNREAAGSPLSIEFGADGRPSPVPRCSGLDGAVARLLSSVYASVVDGTWSRLKACRSDTCQWAFYDRSRNHTGTWCTMAVCGSRMKTRAYRQRRRAAK